MKIAFVGKGGSGKSVVAGTFARVLAATGAPVLALDSDPLPGLAFSVGVELSDAGIPDEAIEEHTEGGPRFRLRDGLSAVEAVERYAATGPDDVRFLQFGKLRGAVNGSLMRSQFVYRQITADLPPDRWNLVGDLPGGTRQPFFGWARFANTILIVVEPTAKSLLSARRLARLALAQNPPRVVAIANKIQSAEDAELVEARTGLPVIAVVPDDPAIGVADRAGRALVDVAPASPAVAAVASLVERLRAEEATQ